MTVFLLNVKLPKFALLPSAFANLCTPESIAFSFKSFLHFGLGWLAFVFFSVWNAQCLSSSIWRVTTVYNLVVSVSMLFYVWYVFALTVCEKIFWNAGFMVCCLVWRTGFLVVSLNLFLLNAVRTYLPGSCFLRISNLRHLLPMNDWPLCTWLNERRADSCFYFWTFARAACAVESSAYIGCYDDLSGFATALSLGLLTCLSTY